jgi:hypothetical protein
VICPVAAKLSVRFLPQLRLASHGLISIATGKGNHLHARNRPPPVSGRGKIARVAHSLYQSQNPFQYFGFFVCKGVIFGFGKKKKATASWALAPDRAAARPRNIFFFADVVWANAARQVIFQF